jgi:hypothetical protein
MPRKSFIVLDTNVWVYTTRLLSTGLGAALIYSLHQTGRILVLPEVLEEEIKKHTLKRGKEAVEAIHEHYRLIEQLMGTRDDFRVPSETEISQRVEDRLKELGHLIIRTQFTINHARAALKRVMEEMPPNGYQNQQFKDSSVWESILEIGMEGAVDFVTEDKAFFKDRKPNLGLAENLKEECKKLPNTIRVYPSLSEYLETVKEEFPPLNNQEIAEKINDSLETQLQKRATDKGFELLNLKTYKIAAFLTEKTNIIAIDFELHYNTKGVRLPESKALIEAIEVVKGDGLFDISQKIFSEVQFNNIFLIDMSGDRIPVFGEGFLRIDGIVLGRKTIPYRLREPIDKE